ncbi:MAG: L,D-transpeptidase [Rhizobiaceae bacterium]|nr:L,D-transpeptidase [Rhizobiaceae bacterium]
MRFLNYLSAFVIGLTVLTISPIVAEARSVVSYKGIARGSIVIRTSQRRLYLGLGNGKAMRYSVGVGRSNKQWTGQKRISSKRIKPAWSPTAQILRDKPGMVKVIAGGSPSNPMGAAALLLSGRGQYAIHGTNRPGSIGGFVSYGCIRMLNKDIQHLYKRVSIGTRVTVTR